MSQFTKISLSVEMDGKLYFVAVKDEHIDLLMSLVSSISDNGKLGLLKAPADYKFQPIKKESA